MLAETLRRCDARHCARLAVVLKGNLGETLTASPTAPGGERSNGRHLRGQFWFLGARLPRGACILCACPEQKRPRNLPTLQAAGSAHVDQNYLRPLRLRARMRRTCFDERIWLPSSDATGPSTSATAVASSPSSVALSDARSSSSSHCAHDGHRFESPQLHQVVRANRRDFLRHRIARHPQSPL